jgi:site-specific DNA recombinase
MKTAAIYARVSSDKQKEENTIASQTAALTAFAAEQGYAVPTEWIFEDEGYSGASLIRPGLERVRDLAAEGELDAVLVYAPDRLSRRYAYQILLIEELARAGVETLFIRSPRATTAEDQLLLQFQGMIAEYERAQILERSRRGKRHRARQGQVSVLSGAPFGYRYVRKSEQSAAYYEINEVEAPVVRWVYERYTIDGLSIGAITRLLNEQRIPTRKQTGRWERSTVWAMLRNPAYKGAAGFGKTQTAPRQRITRPLRLRGGIASRDSAHHERPQDEWIAIPVPPIIDEQTFALAQERLEANKTHAPRRTVVPSVVQGLVSCANCGYALYRTSTRSTARTIYYYRCLGSDAWRRLGGPLCHSRPIRQDLLDRVAWTEIVKLLEEPGLIQSELDRRLEAARHTDPTKRREEGLRRDLARLQKSIARLLTAYQEDLLSLDELRHRMPELRRREYATRAELQSIADQTTDRTAYLRLAETLTAFLARLRSSAETLDIIERQRVVRLLVKEILVSDDRIVIRHSIPIPTGPSGSHDPSPTGGYSSSASGKSYLLRSGSERTALRGPLVHRTDQAVFHHPGLEKRPDEFEHPFVGHPRGHPRHQTVVIDPVEKFFEIKVNDDAVARGNVLLRLGHGLMGGASRSEAVTVLGKRRVPAFLQNLQQGLLDQSVDDARHAELSDPAVRLGDFDPSDRLRLVGSFEQLRPNAWPMLTQVVPGVADGHPIDAGTALVLANAFPRSYEILSIAHLLH